MKRFIYCLLISLTFLMSQEPCEGTCLSEEQTINITNSLKELEFKDSTNTKIISNLNGQIKLYMEQHANDILLINLNEQKSILLNIFPFNFLGMILDNFDLIIIVCFLFSTGLANF